MNAYFLILFAVLVSLIAGTWIRSRPFRAKSLANDGALTVGTHKGARLTGYHESAPVTTRFLLAVRGTAGEGYYKTPTSTLQQPLAVCTDEPAATTDLVNFQHLCGADTTVKMVAAGAITSGVPVVTNGDGKIRAVPNVAGMYWCVGYALTAATTDLDLVEVAPALFPIGVDVIT